LNPLPGWFKGYLYPQNLVIFKKEEELESPLLLVALMKNKYLLHVINEMISMAGPLKDFVYIHEYRKIIASI
jgi:hypothetical protein